MHAHTVASRTASGSAARIKKHLPILAYFAMLTIFVLVVLGPSLIGQQTLMGFGMLGRFSPWSSMDAFQQPYSSNVYITDQIDSQLPAIVEIRQRLADGDWPLISNLAQGSTSLLLEPSLGLFTPTRLSWLLLPLTIAPAWVKVFEILFGTVFTFCFTRRLGLGRIGATSASIIYPLSGFGLAWSGWPQATVAALIPMLFWSIERFLQRRHLIDVVPVSITVCFMLLAGFPIVTAHSLLFAGLYALVRVVFPQKMEPRNFLGRARNLTLLLASVLTGVALSAFQVFPFLSGTVLGSDLSYRDSWGTIQDPLYSWLSTVFPRAVFTDASPQDTSSFIGSVVLALIAVGFLSWISRGLPRGVGTLFFLVCVFVLAFISFQSIANWSDLLQKISIFGQNPPGRLRAQLTLPAAVFAGLGVSWLAGEDPTRRWKLRRHLSPGFSFSSLAMATVAAAFSALLGYYLYRHAESPDSPYLTSDLFFAFVPLAVIWLGFLVAHFWRGARPAVLVLIVAAILVQVFPAARFFLPTSSPAQTPTESQALDFLADRVGDNAVATAGLVFRPNVPNIAGVRLVNGHGFASSSWKMALEGADSLAFSTGGTYSYLNPGRFTLFDNAELDRLGVTYVAAAADETYPGLSGTPVPLPGTPDQSSGDTELSTTPASIAVPAGGVEWTFSADPTDMNGVIVPMTSSGKVQVDLQVLDQDQTLLGANTVTFTSYGNPIELPVGVVLTQTDAETVQVRLKVTPVDSAEVSLYPGQNADQPAAVLNRADDTTADYPLVYAGENVLIWQRTTALPRLRLTSDPAGSALLETDEGELTVVNDFGDRIELDVTCDQRCYATIASDLSGAYVASVDGEETELFEVRSGNFTVALPAGTHRVSVDFDLPLLALGVKVSAGAFILVLTIIAVSLIRARRRNAAETGTQTEGAPRKADA